MRMSIKINIKKTINCRKRQRREKMAQPIKVVHEKQDKISKESNKQPIELENAVLDDRANLENASVANTNPQPHHHHCPYRHRPRWYNGYEFILSGISVTTNVLNFWNFPREAYLAGGGAFIILYIFLMITVAWPLTCYEILIGQINGAGTIKSFQLYSKIQDIGIPAIYTTAVLTVLQSAITSYIIYYLYAPLDPQSPWIYCNAEWGNTEICYTPYKDNIPCSQLNATLSYRYRDQRTTENDTLYFQVSDDPPVRIPIKDYRYYEMRCCNANETAPYQFFHRQMLNNTAEIGWLGWPRPKIVAAFATQAVLLFLSQVGGIYSVGMTAYFTVLLPSILLVGLVVASVIAMEATDYMKKMFIPRFEDFFNVHVWGSAIKQMIITIQFGSGTFISYGSYNHIRYDSITASMLVIAYSIAIQLLSIVFFVCILTVYAKAVSIDGNVNELIQQGPSLLFVTYPTVITNVSNHKIVQLIWAIAFYMMLFAFTFGSLMLLCLNMVTSIEDFFPKLQRSKNVKFISALAIVLFLVGLPFLTQGGIYYLVLLEYYTVNKLLFVASAIEIFILIFFYGPEKFVKDIIILTRLQPPRLLFSFLYFLCAPVVLAGCVYNLTTNRKLKFEWYVFPRWCDYCGWAIVLIALVFPFISLLKRKKQLSTPIVNEVKKSVDSNAQLSAAATSESAVQDTERNK